jgi:hypothetical protein
MDTVLFGNKQLKQLKMPNKKITQFNTNTNINGDNLFVMAASGSTYKVTTSGMTNYIKNIIGSPVTGGTFLNSALTLKNNTGGTISITGISIINITSIGSTPNPSGATISGSTLILQPANDLYGGIVSTGNQSFSGSKTFNNVISSGYYGTAIFLKDPTAGPNDYSNIKGSDGGISIFNFANSNPILSVEENILTLGYLSGASINSLNLTQSRNYSLPNKSGTFAMTNDVLNFANSDLIATNNRIHDFTGYSLTINNITGFSVSNVLSYTGFTVFDAISGMDFNNDTDNGEQYAVLPAQLTYGDIEVKLSVESVENFYTFSFDTDYGNGYYGYIRFGALPNPTTCLGFNSYYSGTPLEFIAGVDRVAFDTSYDLAIFDGNNLKKMPYNNVDTFNSVTTRGNVSTNSIICRPIGDANSTISMSAQVNGAGNNRGIDVGIYPGSLGGRPYIYLSYTLTASNRDTTFKLDTGDNTYGTILKHTDTLNNVDKSLTLWFSGHPTNSYVTKVPQGNGFLALSVNGISADSGGNILRPKEIVIDITQNNATSAITSSTTIFNDTEFSVSSTTRSSLSGGSQILFNVNLSGSSSNNYNVNTVSNLYGDSSGIRSVIPQTLNKTISSGATNPQIGFFIMDSSSPLIQNKDFSSAVTGSTTIRLYIKLYN